MFLAYTILPMTSKKLHKIISILKDWLVSIYLYRKDKEAIPVFILKEVNFIFLDSIRSFFAREKFIILTEDDIHEGSDVFCLKLLHIKNHSDLFYGEDIIWTILFTLDHLRSALELEIRNKHIQLREEYLSQDNWKFFLRHILPGMKILREWALYLKHPNITLPQNAKELLWLFDVAWSCNSECFYYLIDDTVDDNKISSLIQDVHNYLSEICIKINNFTL